MKKLYYSAAENIKRLAEKESQIEWGRTPNLPFKDDTERINYYEQQGRSWRQIEDEKVKKLW